MTNIERTTSGTREEPVQRVWEAMSLKRVGTFADGLIGKSGAVADSGMTMTS